MAELLALAVGVSSGVGLARLSLLAATLYFPLPTLGLVALAVRKQRSRGEKRAVVFCDGVAGELRSGASLRAALSRAARSVDAFEVAAPAEGMAPMESVARAARVAFPGVGKELELTISAVATSGAGGADLFDEIGTLSLAQDEVSREVRVASAPARATGVVFLSAPVVYLLFQARSGALIDLLARPGQRMAVVVGLVLFVAGLVAASWIMWRSR